MNNIMKEFMQTLEDNGVKYLFEPQEKRLIVIRNSLEVNSSVILNLMVVFSDDCKDVQIRIYGLGKVEVLSPKVLEMVNLCNSKYRWYNIYIDNEKQVVMQMDLDISKLNDGGESILEKIIVGLAIANDMYSDIMRAIWAPLE